MISTVDLRAYDAILVNASGGKDSSVAAWYMARLAEAFGVQERVVLVHATFAEEWEDALDTVRAQARQLGLALHVVSRGERLLDYVRRRGRWPSARQRYCTSDFKRAPIDKVITRVAAYRFRQARVLNVLGIRAQESPARARRVPFERDRRRTNGRRIVDTWLPIFTLTEREVWTVIQANRIPVARAYGLGFQRLSCRICIFASRQTLLARAWEHPDLFREYVETEAKIGQRFHQDVSLAEVWQACLRGERPEGTLTFGPEL